MFSLRIVTTDHYQATPLPDLDVEHSEFRGSDVFKVPVIRVYGSTPGGQKTCMHVHGVFPYLYVPYDGTQPWDRYLRLFASSLDKAINVAQGHPTSNIQHVYKITLVSGIPMYGFHEKEEQFLKIYLYNPGLVKKVADLLLGGAVMNQVFQPHESHIPYTLQMFIDYNLYGMNMLNLAAVKFRRKPEEAGNDVRKSSQDSDITTPKFRSFSSEGSSTSHDGNQIWDVNTIPREMYVEASRQSTCELEVDAVAADILNRLEVDSNVGGNPGLAALWEDEKQRRRDKGESSQITPQDSQEREDVEITESDGDQQEKFRQIVLQLQPYIDSQSESDDGSQKEELFDASPPPASQVELHLSQREDMSGSSQDTVMLEEEDQAVEPVINLESIHRVVSFSQSFHLPDSQPSSQPLDDTQDRSLAQILAALADESSPPSSQAAASQVSALEEQDSILHDKSIVPDEKLELEDEEETIEMSQMIGIEEEQQDDQSSEHEVSYDLAGIDDTWTDSQIQAVDDKEDDNEEEDKIPQFDGAADEKPDEKPKSKKRLGVRGPIISGHHQLNPPDNGNQAHQSQGHLSYQGNMSGGHMMYGGGSYGSSRSGNTNYVGYQQQQTQQFHPPQHQHHHLQHQQTHHQQHRQQQQQHLGQSHQSHPQGLNTNSGNDLSGNYMNMYGNNSQGWGQTFPVSEQQQRGTGGYGRMESWGSYDERGNQDWSNQMSSVQRNIAVQSPTQHHSHSTLNSPVETLQNINSPPAKMDSPQGMLHSPTAVLQSTHSTLSSPDTILQSPHSNMQSPQSTIQSPPSAVQSPQLTIQSPNHTSTQPNPQQPMSSPGMSSTGSRTPMASPPLPNFRGHQYEGKNSQEYPAGYQQYNYPGGTYNTMDYSAQPPSQNVHGGYSFGSQQQQYYQPSAGHQNNYNQSSYYRAAPNTYLPNPQSRNTGAVDNRTQINFTESKNNFKRKLKQKLMEKQLNSKPLSPPNLQSPTLPRNKGTVSFPSQNTVNCNTAPQKPPHKPQSQLEKLLMADDDDDDSQASQEIGQRSLSRCSNTSNASSSRGSEKPHPPQSSNSSSVSSFSPLPESIRGNENSSLKFSSDSSAIHESSQQTGNSVQSISGRQNSLNGSSDDLFFDNMSQPSSSNTSMFNDLFNPDNLSPPSFQHPPENRELRIDGNLNSPNFQGDLIRSPIPQAPAQSQTPFSQVKKKNTSSFSSLESLENLVSSVQRNTFYGVNVDQQETGGSAHGQHSQGLARSHLNSHESSSGLQNQLDYTDLQGGHINISQSHEEAASRYTKSSQHQHCSDRNMSQSYWNTHGSRDGVNNERSHDHFTQQLTSNAYYQNTQNTNYMKSNSPLKKTHTVPPNYNSRMSGQGHIHQYQALQTQLSQTHHLNHNVSSSSNLNYPAAQKTHGKMAKLKRSLSLPTVPKKRGRPRKCDVNLATARNRSNSVVLENKPLTYNPAYTFAFHVPSPVFKRLKFHNNHPPNDYGIKVVRMHPKDARKYSLMKVGREIVKLQKLTKKQIAEHTSEIAHRKQTLTSVNTESKPMVLDDKTGVMVTVEKSENVEKDSVEGTSKNVIITESETNRDMCGSPMNRSESGNDDTEVSVELDTNTVSNVDRTVSKNGESEAGFSQHDKEISTDLPHGNHVDIHESYSVEQEIQKKKSLDNPVCVTDSSNEYTEKNTTMCNSNSIIGREVQCISNTSVQPLRWNETNLGEGTSKVPVKEECSIPVTEISESQSMLPSSDAIKHQISTGCERTIEKVQAKTCLKDVLVKTSENSSNDSVRSLESDSTDDSIVKKCCKTTLSTHKDKNCEPELYTEIRSTMFNSIIEKVLFHSVDKGSKNMVEKANIPGKKSGNVPVTKCSAQDSVYILNQEGIRNFPSMSGQRKKRQQKRCLSTKKRLKVACNGHSFPPVVDPDREESNNVILKDVNLTEASEGKLTPIRGHTPIAGRSPIRMNTNLEQYRLFDADIINNKEELESKLKLLHPNQNPVGHQPNKIDGNIIEKDEYFDRFCDSPVSSVKSLSSRTSSRKDSSESANSGSESWKTKLSLRKRKSSSAYSNKITGCRKSLRQRKEKSFSFENSGSELDCVFEKERKDPVKKKKKKAKEVAGIDYIVIGRFKGHTSMRVGIERLDIDPDEFVNVPEFIADQVRKGDKNLQKPVKNQETTRSSDTDAHESLRKAQSRTPAFELFTKLQNEAFGEEKVGKDDDKSKEVLMGDDIAEHNTDDCVVGKPAVDFDDEDSNESLKDCQMEDNESDSGSGENKPLLKRRRSRRGSRRKLTRNQKLHVAFLGKRTRKKKSLGNIDKLLNSLSLLHDATIANLNDSSTTSYSDACKTEDFKVKYEDAMFKMSFLSSSDSDRGGISPPHPLSPEELAKDHQGLTRSTSDVQSPVLSASENSLSPAHHCVPYHQKECSVSDLRSSPIYPFTVTNHKLSSGIFQNCSSEDTHPLINSVSDNKIYSSSDNRVAYHSPPPPLLNIDNHEKLYKRDEQVYCTQGGIDIKKATKAIVKLKPLSNKDIEQYCCKSGPEQASGSLLIEKRSELVSKNISLSIRDLDALCQKEVSSNYSTSSPPDLGPPNIPKYPNSSGYLEDSDLPPPLLIHRSPRSQKPDFTGYGMFENSFSKSPASCCSSGSLNVVHSDRFSDISEDEEDDESRVMTEDICKDTACLHTSSMQSYGSQTGVINSTHDLPVLNHEHSNESPMTASAEKTNIQKNCTKEKSEVCNNNISHDNLMSRKTPEQSEKTVDGDSVKGVNKSSDNTSRDGELFNHEKELTSKKQRILTPSIPPPSRKSVQDTAAGCGLNTGVIQPAYYSNPDDLPEQPRELGGRVFKVQSFRVNDLTEFEGVVECEGLKTWRDIMMVENRIFSTQDENESLIKRLDQEPQLRFAMMGDRNIIISPCKPPPGRKEVERWAKGRKLWKRLKRDNKSKIDKNCNANENNTCNLKDQSDGYCGTSENMDKNGNNMISKTRVDDYNDNVSATAEVADDSAYLNDTIMDVGNEQKHLNFSDSLDIVNVKKDDDMKMEVQSDNLDNDEDIISPSPPSGQRLSQFSAFDHYRHVKSVELNPDHLSTSTPTRIGDVEFRSQQTSVGDKELTNASTPSISNRFVSLSQGGKHSTPIQRKRLANLFGSAFTPIKSGEKESTVEKMRSNDDVNKVGTPRFAMPRKVPLPRRQSSNSSDCMQRSLQASQLGQFATPVNKKGHVSQIDAPTPQNSFGFKVSQQNLQNAKALHEVQNLTILSMELHAESRVELRPDPEVDPILAIFYSISNDVSPDKGKRQVKGAIIVDRESADCQDAMKERSKDKDMDIRSPVSPQPSTSTGQEQKSSPSTARTPSPQPSTSRDTGCRTPSPKPKGKKGSKAKGQTPRSPAPRKFGDDETIPDTILQKSGVDCELEVTYVREEAEVFSTFLDLVARWDPDIFVGYEIQNFSWGFLLQRAAHLSIPLTAKLSRIPEEKKGSHFSAAKDEYGADHASEIHVVGRIVLNLWRLIRHEVTLNIYSFENVTYHVLHHRIPHFSFRTLNLWFSHRTHLYRWRVIEYYLTRVNGNLQIMEQLDLIGRTSEFARVFGIEFYDVLSRGSQYRVESMMLRLAKPLNYIPVSPSVHQRARMRAPECIPLTLEPESRFYADPVVVVDFQSLYPSIMIAHNYCFCTCLGRLKWLEKAHEGSIEFGCTHLKVPPSVLKKLQKDITVSPNGVVFVKEHIRKGVISSMVEEILNTRIMVKKAMKEHKKDKGLHRLLDARQLGLKLIANVTYGYTGANFSGRMPCIEVGDSIVRKARETLERAIKLVEDTPRWGARVVYGDTDSMFIELKGRSKDDAFKIGYEICDAVTAMNPKPMKLKFEKVYLPCILQTKKRYVGFSYETPDQKEPIFDAKGIETVRRDACTAVSKILEKCIKILFTTRDVSQVKQYVVNQCRKTMEGKVTMQDFIFAKEFRGLNGYKPGACVPALEISRKLLRQDRRAEPRVGERVPYVIVYGPPGLPLIQLVRQPRELLQDPSLRLNATYYITKQILPPLDRVFSLMGVDVFSWYNDMPKFVRVVHQSAIAPDSKKGTISHYFCASNCPVCDEQTNQNICNKCMKDPQTVCATLNSRMRHWDKVFTDLKQVCNNCMGVQDENQPCVSLDCPILFRRIVGKLDASKGAQMREVLEKTLAF